MDALTGAMLRKHAAALPPLDGYAVAARRFAAGETLAGAGEPLTRLCFLVEGYATVYNAMENGRAALLTEYRGVQTIGEVELLTDCIAFGGSVRASTKGVMLCVPLPGERNRLLADAAMLRFLGREVARKLEKSSRLSVQDRLYPAAARLAAWLLYAEKEGSAGAFTPLRLTRLGELLGISYRHLLRTLRVFCDRSYILRGNGGYRILDAQALVRLAGDLRYD
jgi:CRP/FNR family transcriptional regulator, putaive post-exponential-phase nitrogen-starvation regulator